MLDMALTIFYNMRKKFVIFFIITTKKNDETKEN
jgi:hypothetical protein